MNSTSFGSRLVRIAARSPGRSSTGPEVWRRLTPISLARMWASVVLPKPGGPNSSTWSSASLRPRAACTKISNWPRILSCPMYSASVAGRRLRSICSSCAEEGLAEIRRSVSTATSGFCQSLQGGADAFGQRQARGQPLDRGERLFLAVAEADQGVEDVIAAAGLRVCRQAVHELALELQQQPFGGFLADAGDLGEARAVLQRHRLRELPHGKPRQYRQRGARAHARDADEPAEGAALLERGKAIQDVGVLAHEQVRVQGYGIAGRGQAEKSAHRHVYFVAHAAGLHQHLGRILGQQLAGKTTDQTRRPFFILKFFVSTLPSRPPCAWQIAQASASAASGLGSPGSASSLFTMCCTCSFLAWPLPTTACLTCSAVYSAIGSPAITAAQIADPRA